jgi:hypothetical protein
MGVGGKLGAKRRSEQRRKSTEKRVKSKDEGMPFDLGTPFKGWGAEGEEALFPPLGPGDEHIPYLRLQTEDGRTICVPRVFPQSPHEGAMTKLFDYTGDACGYIVEGPEVGQIVVLTKEKLIFINGKPSPLHSALSAGITHLLENPMETEADLDKLVEVYNAAVSKEATHH